MKAVKTLTETLEYKSERGDFYICEDKKGKTRMIAKRDSEIIEIETVEKAKVYKKTSNKLPEGKTYANNFNSRLKTALEAEHGRKGLSIEQLKRL